MKNTPFILVVLAVFSISPRIFATSVLDETYSMKSFAAAVINPQEQPVYTEHVENEMVRALRGRSRVEFSDRGYLILKDRVTKNSIPAFTEPTNQSFAPLAPTFRELWAGGVHSVLLAKVIPQEENYRVMVILIATRNSEVVLHKVATVDNRFALESFSLATRMAVSDLFRSIPFDGTILNREGYRVVMDRGFPELRVGMQVSAFTVQQSQGHPVLEETGNIVVTKVEDNISFGRVVVERKPLEVNGGNKIRLPSSVSNPYWNVTDEEEKLRAANLLPPTASRHFGYVDVNLGASFVNMSNSTDSGSGVSSENLMYPGGSLRTEIWITNHYFFDFGFSFGLKTLAMPTSQETVALNSNVSEMRGQMGYRFFLSGPEDGPTMHVKLGFARQEFKVDTSPDPLSLNSTVYSGLALTGGARFPVTSQIGVGFDVGTLLFPSFSESPYTSGAEVIGKSAWDFRFKAYYRLSPTLDIDARVVYQSNTVDFTGQGTRPVAITTISQMTRTMMMGLSYYF